MKNGKPRNGRAKGAGFELRIAKAFSSALGVKLRRTPMSGGWSHDNPEVSGDLVCVEGEFKYCVECKCAEGWRLESLFTDSHVWFDGWWAQLMRECPADRIPLLVFSRARMPVFVAMRYDEADNVYARVTMHLRMEDESYITIVTLDEFLNWVKISLQ